MKNIFKKIAFIAFLLALVAGSIAFFYFQRGSFSEADLRVEVIGPEDVEVGQEVEYSIRYRNNSDIRLENVSITFEYPDASVPVKEDEDEVTEERETFRRVQDLDNLNPGQEEIIDFKAKIFGEEGDAVEARAWFNYTPQNLSAEYEVERTHTGIITNVPISFEFDLPNQTEDGEEFPFRVRYFSHLDEPLENLGIKLDYPSGFEFLRSTPSGLEDNQWEREFLGGNEGALIEVFGILNGDPGDVKGFKGEIGVWKFDRFITLKRIDGEILIPQPNLFVDVVINDNSEYVANPGEDLLYDIYFKNIGDQTLEDLFLTVDLDSEIIDMDGVEPMGGRFQKEAGSIIWSHSSFSELRRLRPDEEEKISFWAKIKEENLPYNPEVITSLSLSQVMQESRVKVNTEFNLEQDFVVEEDPFQSEGPFPLRLNRPSTYTINWKIENLYNDLEDVEVVTTIPEDVGIVEKDYGEDEELEFNSRTRELTWSLERVERGAGASLSSPEVNFQLEIIPTTSADEETILLDEATIRGVDGWTERELEVKAEALTQEDILQRLEIDIDSRPQEVEFEDEEEAEEEESESN